jgi:hypothetical protein
MPHKKDEQNGTVPALTLASLRVRKVPFSATLGATEEGGAEVILPGTFNPRSYSPKRLIELRDMDNEDPAAWAQVLAGGNPPLLCSWELTWGQEDADAGYCKPEDVGKPVPITVENLSGFPIEILGAIARAIGETARPNSEASPEPSKGGSFREDESGPVLTNTELSKPPDTSEEP